VVIEKIYKHEPSGKVCSFECWYRYESYIVTFAEGVDIGEVKTWEKLNLTDADIVVDYEDADDISSTDANLSNLPEGVQEAIQNFQEDEDLAWDEVFENYVGLIYFDTSHRIQCEVSIEPYVEA
jgi:hypothetical protein